MKLLLSAYACAPGYGSEPEVGLQALEAALVDHEVWVLTQPHMAEQLQPWLRRHPRGDAATVLAVEPPAPVGQSGLAALARTQLSHERWQRAAGRRAVELHRSVGFDVVHHVTLAAYWMRTAVTELDVPLVWGPVGGAVEPPARLVPELGVRGALEDGVRTAVRLLAWRRPAVRATARRAQVVLVQNGATARRLEGLSRPAAVLPNALCVSVPAVRTAGRRRDVAVVGRVVAWKAVPMAVRVLAALRDQEVVLRVYGQAEGGELERVREAARRHGVADRVEVVGRLPREELLARVASSGVLLHPSLHDEASFTVAEALALGTPVVALDHGGPPHVAAHWPAADVRLVRPAGRAATVRGLALAVDELLELAPDVPATPTSASVSFAEVLRSAWTRAAAQT